MASIPGPRGLPLVGNLHQLGPRMHETFLEFSRQYGEVFRINLGGTRVVVLSGRSAIEQALTTKSTAFAGRPDNPYARTVTAVRNCSIIYEDYSEDWREKKEFFAEAFRAFASGENGRSLFEKQASDEAQKVARYVESRQSPAKFDATYLAECAALNMLTRLHFGDHLELDDPLLTKLLENREETWKAYARCAPVNIFPWLNFWLPGRFSTFRRLLRRQQELLDKYMGRADPGDGSADDTGSIDLLQYANTHGANLDTPDDRTEPRKFNEDVQRSAVREIFAAGGFVSLGPALNWALYYAIALPEWQRDVQEELDSVVGRGRLPTLAERVRLPLTESFLAETCRHSAMIPVSFPHATTEDTSIELPGDISYTIPRGTMVLFNYYALFRGPDEWDNPEQFDARRYLTEDGGLDRERIDYVKQRRFGGGARKCLGWRAADEQLFVFFATLMHQFSLGSIPGQQLPLEGVMAPGSVLIRPPVVEVEIVRR